MRSSIVKIAHADGELELTPDHVLLVDGQWAAARTVKVCGIVSLIALPLPLNMPLITLTPHPFPSLTLYTPHTHTLQPFSVLE